MVGELVGRPADQRGKLGDRFRVRRGACPITLGGRGPYARLRGLAVRLGSRPRSLPSKVLLP
jgi:hypothetical protein